MTGLPLDALRWPFRTLKKQEHTEFPAMVCKAGMKALYTRHLHQVGQFAQWVWIHEHLGVGHSRRRLGLWWRSSR